MKTNLKRSMVLVGLLMGAIPFLRGSAGEAQALNGAYKCEVTSEGGVTYVLTHVKFDSSADLKIMGGIENESNSVEHAALTCKVPVQQPELVPDAKLLSVCDDGVSSQMGSWSHGFGVEVYLYQAKIIAQVSRKGILGSRPVADVPCESSN